jgi:tetratricopeptide (TPR) repeat protein
MHSRVAAAVFLLALLAGPAGAQSVNELNDAGWQALAQGDAARAARLFADALVLRPDDPVLLFGAGTAAHLEGRPADALSRLRRAVQLNPRLTPASLLLGELAYREGDAALAIATYERALKYAPGEEALAARLKEWRADAEVHKDFGERRSDRFIVLFEGREEEPLASRATEVLNAEFWRIGNTLGAFPADAVVVVLYTETLFRDITRAPEWSGGVYDGRIRIPAANASRLPELLDRVLVHELAHAMIAKIAPRGVPAWLHEGLAQHFEGADAQAARKRLQAHRRRLPLAALEHNLANLHGRDVQIAYDESLLAVDVMLQRPGFGWTRLLRALYDTGRVEATLESFGFSYADLEAVFAPTSR